MLETNLYAPLCAGANFEGWRLFKIVDGAPGQKPGDIAGSDPTGRAVLLEVKVLRRSLAPNDLIPWELFSAHQMNWLRGMAQVNALALLALYDERADRMGLYRVRNSDDFHRPAHLRWIGDLAVKERMQFRGWQSLTLP